MEKVEEVSMLDTDPHAGLFTPPFSTMEVTSDSDAVPSTSKGQSTVGNYQRILKEYT
jgi:hypothetical protein